MAILSRNRISLLLVFILFTGSILQNTYAANAASCDWEFGFKGGLSFANSDESFNKYDIYANYRLPWAWYWGESMQIGTNLTAAASMLDAGNDIGMACSLGFEFVFQAEKFPLELRAGEALTLLSEVRMGEEDFGGPVQFTTHIGLDYYFLEKLRAVVEVQHTSNGGLYSENPGINTIMFGLLYQF